MCWPIYTAAANSRTLSPSSLIMATRDPGRRPALVWLAAITLLAGALRFYGIRWAAPYFHFHMDEHYVFLGATELRVSTQDAARLYKFFMYPPLVMHLVNAVRWTYEWVAGRELDHFFLQPYPR